MEERVSDYFELDRRPIQNDGGGLVGRGACQVGDEQDLPLVEWVNRTRSTSRDHHGYRTRIQTGREERPRYTRSSGVREADRIRGVIVNPAQVRGEPIVCTPRTLPLLHATEMSTWCSARSCSTRSAAPFRGEAPGAGYQLTRQGRRHAQVRLSRLAVRRIISRQEEQDYWIVPSSGSWAVVLLVVTSQKAAPFIYTLF